MNNQINVTPKMIKMGETIFGRSKIGMDRHSGGGDPRRLVVAHHEAGHAVASCLLGLDFVEVHIVLDPERNIDGEVVQEPVSVSRDDFLDIENRCIKSLAGIAAEARYRGKLQWKYGSVDFEAALQLAMLRHGEDSLNDVEHYVRFVWARTREFVETPFHWRAICSVAQELNRRERLTEDEVAKIVNATLSQNDDLGERSATRELCGEGANLWRYLVRRSLKKPRGQKPA